MRLMATLTTRPSFGLCLTVTCPHQVMMFNDEMVSTIYIYETSSKMMVNILIREAEN